jgi:hypothetical protein
MRFSAVIPLVFAFLSHVSSTAPNVDSDETMQEGQSTQQSFVVQLTRDTFQSTIMSVPVALVKFATPCKLLLV